MTNMMSACIILHKSNDIDQETYNVLYIIRHEYTCSDRYHHNNY